MTSRTPASEVAHLLSQSKRPLLHFGQGIRHADCIEGWVGFAHTHNIPFVTARNANDIVPSTDPLYIGRPGTFAQRGANFAVQLCDLYLAIGTRLSITQTGYNTKDYARNARIVQVDVDRAELEKGTLRDPIMVCEDAGVFLKELQGLVGLPDWSTWVKRCQYLRDKYEVVLPEYVEQIQWVNSYYFLQTLSDLSANDDLIVTDMGFAFQNTHQTWKVKKGQRLFTNCGLAPMGWGLPAAVGASIGTGRRCICITGEGGLMFNIQELATIAHHKLPIKIFVLNNGGYLTIKQTQEFGFEGRLMGVNQDTGVSFPNFMDIAKAHSIPHWDIWSHRTLKADILGVIENDRPYLCEVWMSPDQPQAPRFVNRRNADGTMNPTPLEDAYPYLPREELAEAMSMKGIE